MGKFRFVVRSFALAVMVGQSVGAYASETCVEDTTREAAIEYVRARRTFEVMAQPVVRQQVSMLQRVRLALAGEDVRLLLESAETGAALPLDLDQEIFSLQASFLEVRCMRGERVFFEDEWVCLHPPQYAAEDGEYPPFVKELSLDGTQIYACAEYVTRDGVSPAVDAWSCAVLDLETGEIHGSNPHDSIDGDVVGAHVFAFVNDIPLHESVAAYASHRVEEECGL